MSPAESVIKLRARVWDVSSFTGVRAYEHYSGIFMNYTAWTTLLAVMAASYILVDFQTAVELGAPALLLIGTSALVMARTNNSGT